MLKTEIVNFLTEALFEEDGDILAQSYLVLELVVAIEKKFKIKVPLSELNQKNLADINSFAELIFKSANLL